MSEPIPKTDDNNNSGGGVMVGVKFEGGVVLAVSIRDYIYCLNDYIYCCAKNSGPDSKAMLEVATKLENILLQDNRRKDLTMEQPLELITQQFEQVGGAGTELLLAGVDLAGLHMISCKSPGGQLPVGFEALGAGGSMAKEYLTCHWKEDLDLREAEQLARQAANMCKAGPTEVYIIFQDPVCR